MSTSTTFNKLYKDHQRPVQNFIFKMVHSIEVAEELTNDVFMKAYNNLEKFDETKSNIKTWIFNIAKNYTIDHLRKGKLKTTSIYVTGSDGEEATIDYAAPAATPEEELISSEQLRSIGSALQSLPKQQAELLTLYAAGHSYEEMAETFGIPMGTVKGSIHLARTKMKDMFNRPVLA